MTQEVAERQDWDLSAIGLRLTNPDLPYEEFERLCFMLGGIHGAVRFAIGDAIQLGETLYGSAAHQALELLNLSEEGRLEYVRVSQKVPRSVRRKDLSWSHHRAVAGITIGGVRGGEPDHKKQKEWLKRASEEQLSHHQLRDELRNGSEPRAEGRCRCCGGRIGADQ